MSMRDNELRKTLFKKSRYLEDAYRYYNKHGREIDEMLACPKCGEYIDVTDHVICVDCVDAPVVLHTECVIMAYIDEDGEYCFGCQGPFSPRHMLDMHASTK